MITNTPQRRPAGHTLMELVAAMLISSVLLAGLGSVMLIARQVAYAPTSSTQRIETSRMLVDLSAELRFATFVTERTANSLEFVAADRNGDGTHERIRYAWSGTAGDPLLRTYNGGSPHAVIDAVEQLQFGYTIDTETTTIATTTDSAESLLVNYGAGTEDNRLSVTPTQWVAQQINPGLFATAAPANCLYWKPTRVDFLCEDRAEAVETLAVQLRSAGAPNDGPTSQVLTQATIAGSDVVNKPTWNSVSFSGRRPQFALHRKYALVWIGSGGSEIIKVCTDNAATGTVLLTADAGASWQYLPTEQAFVRLYGTYATPGPSYNVTRSYLSNVDVLLQAGSQQHARVETSISLDNRPEILADYWRTDFDTDPTVGDANGDGAADWQGVEPSPGDVASPQPYDPATLAGGVWYVSGELQTQPLCDFAEPTILEVGFRDTVPGGSGAVATINSDWFGGLHAPLAMRVQMQSDGSQTFQMTAKSSDTVERVLLERPHLSADMIRCRLTILPDQNLVNVHINDEDQGTYAYFTYAPSSEDRFVSLYGDTSGAEFDYAEVRVLEP